MKKFINLCGKPVLYSILFLGIAAIIWQSFRTSASELVNQQNTENYQEKAKGIADSPVFAEFNAWVKQYVSGKFTADSEQNQSSENLAIKRQEVLKELIRTDPKTALEQTISADDYNRLPSFITKYLEKRISGNGDFLVSVSSDIDSSTEQLTRSLVEREVVMGNTRYKAFVYGRREMMTTKLDIPLQGIVLDGLMAVDENPVRKLKPAEYESRGVDLGKLGEYGIVVEVGSKIVYLSNQSEFDNFAREQIEWEAKIGPVRPKENLAPEELASPWTEGLKTILFIRVDFADRLGEPVDSNNQPLTLARAQNLINNEISPFYVSSSYNKTSLQTTVTTVVRLPQPLTFYEQGNNDIMMLTDARNAARTAGFETNNFDLDIVAFSYSQNLRYGGRGYVGGKGIWLNGSFDLRITAHELGHNYGLWHANSWQMTDGTPIGQGNTREYGDRYDMMGGGGGSQYHFNANYKRRLDWLTDTNVQTVTSDGVYRIFAEDSSAPGGIRALNIRKDDTRNYWVEFRQLFTNNQTVLNGALIRWDYPRGGEPGNIPGTLLLDMTPNTPNNADESLQIGQSFLDNVNRIRMTVLGKGNTTPESLDVRIELNVGCSFSLGQTTQNFSASGGEGNIAVNTQSGCRPPATSNNSWLSAVPTDTGTVRYIVAANYGSQPRTGTLTVAGQTSTVQQGAATTACVASPSGLVAWWRGEGNTLDQTGVNNGTLINNMTFGGGKVGGGFLGNRTNNAGIVEVPDSASLALSRSMTFEGWLKVDSYGGTVISRGTASPFRRSYDVSMSQNGELNFTVWYNNNSGVGVFSDPLPLGQFVHFAASLDDGTGQIKMYINGSLVRQYTITQRPNILSGAKINIGNINGITDELSVYNRPLSASEIQVIYNAGTAATGATGKCLSSTVRTRFDFDGDGKADISVYRPSNGAWYLLNSTSGFAATQFGVSTDKIVPADYDGDGRADIAVYRDGTWFLQRSATGFASINFGLASDIPMPADFDGDGKADLAVFRPSNGVWYVLNLVNNNFSAVQFGSSEDKPVTADYDGDGKSDYAVYRPSNGVWYMLKSRDGFSAVQFGISTDKAVVGDYDGDGKADQAVYRGGTWFLNQSSAGFASINFGLSSDIPAPADFDGDGKIDIAVLRPESGNWYQMKSTQGFSAVQFGAQDDKPTPNAFVR